jgi:hypothetical protein
MPENKQPGPDFLTAEEQAAEADAAQWKTVSEEDVEEIKVSFDQIGDQFIGDYIGPRIIENENGKFAQYRFTDDGEFYFINGGWSLTQAMTRVPKGSRCRIMWTGERDTGGESPMKIMRVDVARKR